VNYGVIIALDDFGTGYSSLSYLKNFPIRYLKIDKSFIDEIFNSKKDYAITGSIINLVHSLDIKTVAEGVETQGQFDYLNKLNIDLVQGYLLGKPLSERDAVKFLLGSRQKGK
ncbi:MAG: EAL domain-containing protein, partial [Clostridiales bacterium]|nr:EAL domain-containing protein [Clostridiales bacterium]